MNDHDEEQESAPRLPPAPMGPRIAAGLFDGFAEFALALFLFWIPFRVGAGAMPVAAMVAVLLGYAVVPLAVFGSTPGMRLFGVELVGRDGKPADFVELLFREIIGRGLGPVAYLLAIFASFIAAAFGMIEMGTAGFSVGLGVWLCSLLVMGAFAGHFVALGREDRRTLADLIGKTMVISRAVAATHTADEDERAEQAAARRKRIVGVVLFELALAAATVVAPIVLSLRVSSNASYAAHLKLQADEKRFAQEPGNRALASELSRAYDAQGEPEKARAVLAKYEAAQKSKTDAREASLRKRLAEAPQDTDAADALIELLEDQNRVADARTVREASYKAAPSAEAQASYGVWLYQHELGTDAVKELQGALDGGYDEADLHAYLGMALLDQGRKPEARHELHVALEKDPDLDQVQDELQNLEAEIGPEPVAKPAPKKKGKR